MNFSILKFELNYFISSAFGKRDHHVFMLTHVCLVRITARLRNLARNLNSIMFSKQLCTE